MARTSAVAMAAAGLLLLGCGIASAGDAWKNYTAENGLPGNEVQFLKQDEAGTVWAGTLTGLGAFKDGKFSVAIEKVQAWDILKAGENAHWVGTNNGAIRLQGDKKETFLAGKTVAPLVRIGKDRIWTIAKENKEKEGEAAKNALLEHDGKEWRPVEAFAKENVQDMFKVSDGTVWVALEANGVAAATPGTDPVKSTRHLEGRNVTTVFEDSRKRIWCGTWEQGVHVYDGKEWTRHLEKEKSAILAVVEDTRGTVWVATSANGLWRHDGKAWTNDLKQEGGINMIAATSDGKVWISSQQKGGLRAWSGKEWAVSLESALPIRCILETSDKKIWAGGVLDGVHAKE